jgi:hypothetical protein
MAVSDEGAELLAWYEERVAAIKARTTDGAGLFRRTRAQVEREKEEDLEGLEELFRRKWEFLQAKRSAEAGEDQAAPTDHTNLTRPRPSLPSDVNLFLFSSIQKAARLLDEGASFYRVADESLFNRHDASRLHWMLGRGLFQLNAGELLPPDWRVAQVGKRYALRFLDEAAWKWVDPAEMRRTPG